MKPSGYPEQARCEIGRANAAVQCCAAVLAYIVEEKVEAVHNDVEHVLCPHDITIS